MLDAIKKAFVLIPKMLKLFYVLAAVNVVTNIISFITIPAPVDQEMSIGKSFLVIIMFLAFIVLGIFIYGGALAHIGSVMKTGAANVASFLDDAKKYFVGILLVTLIMIGAAIVLTILLVIAGVLPAFLRVLLIIVLVLLLIAMLWAYMMACYGVVNSNLGVIDAVKRGIDVVKKNTVKILVTFLILFLIAFGILIVTSVISGLLSFFLRPLSGLITAILMAIYYGIMTVLTNTAYMDIYLKHESGGAAS